VRTATRFPTERYAAIDRALRTGRHPNASTIATELEVSTRTIQRDIEHLRDRHKAPIEYVPDRHGYIYTNPSFRLSCSDLTEGELLALCLAERVLQQYRGTPFASKLAEAFSRLTAGLDRRMSIDLSHLGQMQSFRVSAVGEIDPGLFETLLEAIRQRKRLDLNYWSASRDEETRRLVDPYHLASVDGEWYLVALCHLRKAIRMFVPARIREVRLETAGFEAPADFDIDEFLADAFSVVRGEAKARQVVRLRFTGEAARILRHRNRHRSQRVERQANGELVLSFELSHLGEVARWAMSWGADCQVLEPDALRKRVQFELERAAALYVQATPEGRRSRRTHGTRKK
jgi:predicted DNA-binding transcriptional regulator YafY